MNSVEKFNALNGKKVNRDILDSIRTQAFNEQQWEVFNRIVALEDKYPNVDSFQITIIHNAEQIHDADLNIENKNINHELFLGLPYEPQCNNDQINGLGKPVSSEEIYDMITNTVLDLIKTEKGLFWRKTWKKSFAGLVSLNFSSKKNYRGINAFLLNIVAPLVREKRGNTTTPYWLTFKQIEQLGGELKKESKGQKVIYFTKLFRIQQKEPFINFGTYNESKYEKFIKDNEKILNDSADYFYLPILKYYNVYNSADIDGIIFPKFKPVAQVNKNKRIEVADKIVKHFPNPPKLNLEDVGDRAFYTPSIDTVTMPKFSFFDGEQEYYSTFFHELIHSTGHKKRLSRNFKGKFGSKSYAFEELIAELGALFLCAESGIMYFTLNNSAAYLKGWQKRLEDVMKSDNKFFFRASSKAQAATDYILSKDKKGKPKYLSDKDSKRLINSTKLKSKEKKSQLALFGYIQTEILEVKNTFKNEANSYVMKRLKESFALFNNKNFKNLELNKSIHVNRTAKTKTLFGGKRIDSYKATAIMYLPHLIKFGKVISYSEPKLLHINKFNAKKIISLESKIKIDDKTRYYVITIFETRRGLLKYYIDESNIKKSVKFRNGKAKKQSIVSNRRFKDTKKKHNKGLGTLTIDVSSETKNDQIQHDPVNVNYEQPKPIMPKPDIKTSFVENGADLNELKKLGFDIASEGPSENIKAFRLPGAIGGFLQDIQAHKALILIKGPKHTSKSQLAMQIANAFGEKGDPVAFIDYEQGGLISKDTQNSVKWNTTTQGRGKIAIIGHLENPIEQLKMFCKHCKVIVADSVTDLSISADELNELRTSYPQIIWIFISQVKENGQMYGGNKMAHNPTCIIECHPNKDPKKRYATLEKNRGNDLSVAYSIYEKTIVDVERFTNPLSQLPKQTSI